jgi:ankyrin repeat protein
VVKELLKNNANIEANKDKCTPLIGGMLSLLELYLLYSPFFYKASENKHVEVVKLLLAKSANIEASSKYDGFTPLLCGN